VLAGAFMSEIDYRVLSPGSDGKPWGPPSDPDRAPTAMSGEPEGMVWVEPQDPRGGRRPPIGVVGVEPRDLVEEVLSLREKVGMGARTADEVARQIAGARWVVTARDRACGSGKPGRLVGFARAITDLATNGYISTVMVDPDYQRRGIGREILRRIVEGREAIRWVLHARKEAMPFYRALGFEDAPDMMWRDRRNG
jgi:ribosomal protein S18 acetylase RimI-like enzyme